MQGYAALKTLWASLNSTDIAANLTVINETVVTAATVDANNNPVPAVLWSQANGWSGLINQNDLVAAGIIVDDQRIQFEAQQNLITSQQATALQSWSAALSARTGAHPTITANQLLAQGITPLGGGS